MSKEKRMESEYQSGRYLPEDLEKKILSKLPVRSLIRFKCVSKKWSSLITADSLFITSHLEHQHQFNSFTVLFLRPRSFGLDLSNHTCTSTRLMFLRDESNALELDQSHILTPICDRDLYIYDKELYIHDMTVFRNGLVCILTTFLKSWKTILWNPATREFRELPEPNLHADRIVVRETSINSWFDPHNKDYKLLRMAKIIAGYSHLDDSKEGLLVHEFSLKSNCWSEVKPYPRLTNDLLSGSKPTWTKQWTSGTPSVGRWCWEDLATFRVNRDEYRNMESSSPYVPFEEDDMSCWQVMKAFEYVESLVSVHPEP